LVSSATAPKQLDGQSTEAYGKIPLSFERNEGQTDPSVDFIARAGGYRLFLSPAEATLALRENSVQPKTRNLETGRDRGVNASTAVLRMQMVDTNKAVAVAGADELEGKVNYFIGNNPSEWHTNVPTFSRVHYTEIYDGIDLIYYGNQQQLEYDFVVAPRADSRQIALRFEGANKINVESSSGDLVVGVGEQIVRQHKPVAYQEVAGEKRKVAVSYALQPSNQVRFEIGEYDQSIPLVIDPVLVYSTYLGGSFTDLGGDIAVDSTGNAYISGYTASSNFPAAGTPAGQRGTGIDVFVTKINAAGTSLVYTAYLGGNSDEGSGGNSIAVDSSGNVYVAGDTS
jgi:hypothetical protein